jgi:hypothetical protein
VMVVTAPSWSTISFPDGDNFSAMKFPHLSLAVARLE